jgi:hypothetical protein
MKRNLQTVTAELNSTRTILEESRAALASTTAQRNTAYAAFCPADAIASVGTPLFKKERHAGLIGRGQRIFPEVLNFEMRAAGRSSRAERTRKTNRARLVSEARREAANI